MLIPSIELVKGRAVQLRRGGELEFVADEDPRDLAVRFGRAGEVAVVDLDAARGTGDNLPLVEELCRLAPCRVGGGIRDVERGQRLLRAGARRLIIGTRAEPEFLQEVPPTKLLAAVDAWEDRVLASSWERPLTESPLERARRLEPFVAGFVYTLVERKGLQGGVDFARVEELTATVAKPVTAAGGVRSVEEIRALDRLGVDAQVGMALYRGTIRLGEAIAGIVDFSKHDGQAITVLQDARDGRVLRVGWSTGETLAESVDTGAVRLHVRGRREEPAAAELRRIEVTCDRSALLMHVDPTGPACRRGTASCFGERPFSLPVLEQAIVARGAPPATPT
jgi:phosphoribosyl-ATP pyrophosphohydrolase/phosphoribosyl-AMP cyclohydrolase